MGDAVLAPERNQFEQQNKIAREYNCRTVAFAIPFGNPSACDLCYRGTRYGCVQDCGGDGSPDRG